MNIFDQGNLGLYTQALEARTKQIETISSNIANEHTPGYKAKQLSFESMISQPNSMSTTDSKHISVGTKLTDITLSDDGGLDQNTVDGLQERMNFVEVSSEYQMVQEFFSAHMSGLKTAFKWRSE